MKRHNLTLPLCARKVSERDQSDLGAGIDSCIALF